ncbi:hypothetical protein L210DRAFT_2672173 [Boletus edulis BED1]|uniref:Uncharacterized protein n=1 Tax=Boletus edulis BED1 TaxID=1328754 RepID=A0AAD4GBS4_BOLED|nr:hypothetical protein L210DRAFT_2672173 [Boletus edulis BED1]
MTNSWASSSLDQHGVHIRHLGHPRPTRYQLFERHGSSASGRCQRFSSSMATAFLSSTEANFTTRPSAPRKPLKTKWGEWKKGASTLTAPRSGASSARRKANDSVTSNFFSQTPNRHDH